MLFDYAISNPPYQLAMSTGEKVGAAPVKNVFHLFQFQSLKVCTSSCFIYPAMRWIQRGGKGMRNDGKIMLNDDRLVSVDVIRNSQDAFPFVGVHDGLSIVVSDSLLRSPYLVLDGQTVLKPGDSIMPGNIQLAPIVSKIQVWMSDNGFSPITTRTSSRSLYGIESDFVEKNPELVIPISEAPQGMSDPVKIITNNMSGTSGTPTWYWIDKDNIPKAHGCVDKYHFVIRSALFANQDGYIEDGLIIGAGTAYGRCKMSIVTLDTQEEIDNFVKYIKSPLNKLMFKESIGGGAAFLGAFIPDMVDYSDDSSLIDFKGEDINSQLYNLYGFTDEDISVLESLY